MEADSARRSFFFALMFYSCAASEPKALFHEVPPPANHPHVCRAMEARQPLAPLGNGLFARTSTMALCDGDPFWVAGMWPFAELAVNGKETTRIFGVLGQAVLPLAEGGETPATRFCFFVSPEFSGRPLAIRLTVPETCYAAEFTAVCEAPHAPTPPCRDPTHRD